MAASSSWTVFGLRSDGTVAVAADECDEGWAPEAAGWSDVIDIRIDDGVYGLHADGTVSAAAENAEGGRLDVGGWEGVAELVPTPTSELMYARTVDGRVLCTDEEARRAVSGWTDVVQLDYSRGWVLALRADGTVYSLGYSEEIAAQVAGWEGVVQVAAAGERGLAAGLRADGTVLFTGDPASSSGGAFRNYDGTVVELPPRDGYDVESLAEIEGWRDVAYIDACNSYLLGLTSDGRVLFAGRNGSYREGAFDTSGWRDAVCVWASDPGFLALRSDGTLEGFVNSPISGFRRCGSAGAAGDGTEDGRERRRAAARRGRRAPRAGHGAHERAPGPDGGECDARGRIVTGAARKGVSALLRRPALPALALKGADGSACELR